MYTIEEFDTNKSKVLKYILYKKRTKHEIKNKFSKTMDEDMLEDIIADLEEKGYINDTSYITRAVNEFKVLQNLSIKEIKYKLISKGVPSSLIEDYLSTNFDDMQEYEINSAIAIINKKQNSMDEEKLMQYMLKKGYKTSSIKEAIDRI